MLIKQLLQAIFRSCLIASDSSPRRSLDGFPLFRNLQVTEWCENALTQNYPAARHAKREGGAKVDLRRRLKPEKSEKVVLPREHEDSRHYHRRYFERQVPVDKENAQGPKHPHYGRDAEQKIPEEPFFEAEASHAHQYFGVACEN